MVVDSARHGVTICIFVEITTDSHVVCSSMICVYAGCSFGRISVIVTVGTTLAVVGFIPVGV